MPAAPDESPINISSASPTPEQPRTRLRSSSSSHSTAAPAGVARRVRISDDSIEIPQAVERRRARPVALHPNARPFVPRATGLAIPSRSGPDPGAASASGSGANTPVVVEGGRAGAGPSRIDRMPVIDLTEFDSDDESEVEITSFNHPTPPRPPPPPPAAAPAAPARRRIDPANRPLLRDLRQLDDLVARRGAAARAILDEPQTDRQRRRAVLSPPPAQGLQAREHQLHRDYLRRLRAREEDHFIAGRGRHNDRGDDDDYLPGNEIGLRPGEIPRRPIGLGGAVLRAGDRQINFGNGNDAAAAAAAARDRRGLDDQVNREIYRRIAERNNAGIPGLLDRLHGRDGAGGEDFDIHGLLGNAAAAFRAAWQWGQMGDVGGGGGPGPAGLANQARALDDPHAIIAQVPKPEYPPDPEGYTSNFGLDDEDNNETIEIDQPVSAKSKPKPFLACVNCVEPLLQSSAYRTPADRVWALRCGHLIDQKCLDKLAIPASGHPAGLPVLDEEEDTPPFKRSRTKRGRAAAARRKAEAPPVEHVWTCPAKECGHLHKVVLKAGAEWKQDELEGAFQIYA